MSRRVSFKLYDKNAAGNPIDELALSLAFQRHCAVHLGITDDLNILVKKVWLKFLRDSVDKSSTAPTELSKAGLSDGVAGDTDEVSQGVTAGNVESNTGLAESPSSDAVAESHVVADSTAATPG